MEPRIRKDVAQFRQGRQIYEIIDLDTFIRGQHFLGQIVFKEEQWEVALVDKNSNCHVRKRFDELEQAKAYVLSMLRF